MLIPITEIADSDDADFKQEIEIDEAAESWQPDKPHVALTYFEVLHRSVAGRYYVEFLPTARRPGTHHAHWLGKGAAAWWLFDNSYALTEDLEDWILI
jgi:hypothetical protein